MRERERDRLRERERDRLREKGGGGVEYASVSVYLSPKKVGNGLERG